MTFDPTGPGSIVPVRRVKPIYASDVGDDGAGGSANMATFANARRWVRAKVATIAARNALSSPANGDTVLVEDNGSGLFQLDVYDSGTASWITIAMEGGVGNAGVPTYKASVRLATTANHGLSGLAAIDGVTPVAGDRVLAKNQTTPSQNGIYVAAAGAWARSTDADSSAEVLPNTVLFVEEGATQADTAWVLTTNATITLGTTSLTFARFGADAVTLNGMVSDANATADTVMARDASGRTKLANHASLGTAAAAGYGVAADAGGFVPVAAIPAGIAGTIQVVASVTAAKALTGLAADALVLVKDLGVFRFSAAQTEPDDNETVIDVTAGGQLLVELPHPDAIFAYLDDELADLQSQIDELTSQSAGALPLAAALTLLGGF